MTNTYFLDQLPQKTQLPSCILTIGNFDGVHLGHQNMLNKVLQIAQQQNLASAVMIFEPQPREYFNPQTAPARLTNFYEKQHFLNQYQAPSNPTQQIDSLIVAKFDETFRSLSAQAFADLLVQRLNVQALVLGDDFRFGHDRTGDSEFLRQYGLTVYTLDTITDPIANERISSTRIRHLLSEGNLNTAKQLLGRAYSMTGQVLNGDKIGRTLDFPTANIALERIKPALHGIFAVDVVMLDTQGKVIKNAWQNHNPYPHHQKQGISGLRADSLFGTASIGTRPSVDKPHDWRLEVHFPEFSGDLYGKILNVRFLHFLHGERHYQDLATLKQGIDNDVQALVQWRQQQNSPLV